MITESRAERRRGGSECMVSYLFYSAFELSVAHRGCPIYLSAIAQLTTTIIFCIENLRR